VRNNILKVSSLFRYVAKNIIKQLEMFVYQLIFIFYPINLYVRQFIAPSIQNMRWLQFTLQDSEAIICTNCRHEMPLTNHHRLTEIPYLKPLLRRLDVHLLVLFFRIS
jgi:hypothetical protein